VTTFSEKQGAPAEPGPLQVDALSVENLSKSFAGNTALDRLTLRIAPGEIHVLVGQNGSGKSTLIKLLSGYHRPDPGGTVLVAGQELQLGAPEHSYRAGCRFVHQDLGLVATSSILDNLSYSGGFPTRWGTVRWGSARAEAVKLLDNVGLNLDPRRNVATLSASERTEVAVARALRPDSAHPPRLLVLDEPTATMPVDEVEHLLATVRTVAASGVAVLLVTHHLDEVFGIANRVSVLRDGRLVATSDIRAVDHRGLVRQLVGSEVEDVSRDHDAPAGTEEAALVVEDLASGPLLGVSFAVSPGEVVGIAGLTGSGRETMLGAIFGAQPRQSGRVVLNGATIPAQRPDVAMKAGIGFMPGDRKVHGGIMPLTARENLTLTDLRPFWGGGRLRKSAEMAETRKWFRDLDIRPADGYNKILATFSGGNQQKVLFAKWLRKGLRVFLLDEPTQGVDVGSKADLHRLILAEAERGMAVVISSTDIDELTALCNRILVLRNGRIQEQLIGDQVDASTITHSILVDQDQEEESA
jgi:ribose transport system ATP-binding protein